MKPRILYIEVDAEITAIVDQIKKLQSSVIYLVIPQKALLFQSLVNLRILKEKMSHLGKKVVLVTTDRKGRHMAEKLGMEAMDSIDVEPVQASAPEAPEVRMQPIQARRNEVVRENPRRATEKKVTIAELVQEYRLKRKTEKKNSELHGMRGMMKPNRKFILFVLACSAGLFMLISYIALPGATISIKPKFNRTSYTTNVTLADKRKNQTLLGQNNPHIISAEEVVVTAKETKVFSTVSKLFEGVNAAGTVTIMNASDEEWPLKKGTRFQSPDGLIFRLKEGVFVPPATKDPTGATVNGQLKASVVADDSDMYGDPVGDRGNIGPTRFIAPGLSKLNQSQLWAESQTPMQGGVTRYRRIVMKEDIEAAKKQIQDNLLMMARDELRSHLDDLNKLGHTNLVLLDDSRYLDTKLLDMRISDDLEGSEKEKFEVFARIEAKGIAYDQDQIFGLLKKEIKSRAHPDMQVTDRSLDPKEMTFEVVSDDPALGQIKITVTLPGIEEFVIEPSELAGQRFGARVKEKVAGLPKAEAQSLISAMPEVDDVQISLWPIWLSSMPRVPENIEIKLMEPAPGA